MPLLGAAVLAIWNDIAPGGDEEFNRWHLTEHMAERIGVPGFLRARRYTAVRGAPRYFTLYETADPGVLQSPGYLARLNSPTPWTTRCIQLFRNNSRTVCRLTASLGDGVGGALATLELGPAPGREAELRRWLAETALRAAVGRPGMVGAHLGEADADNTRVQTAEKKLLDQPDALARWVVLLEGSEASAVETAASEVLGAEALARHGATADAQRAVYQLNYSLRR
jgi:hypothetical protein